MQILSIVPECQIFISSKEEGSIGSKSDIEKFHSYFKEKTLLVPQQVHSTTLTTIGYEKELPLELPIADGFLSNRKDCVFGMVFADCVPIIMVDRKQHALAFLHAGWRGLVSGIVPIALLSLQTKYKSKTNDIWVWIGPCIQEQSYTLHTPPLQTSLPNWEGFINQNEGVYTVNLPGFVTKECTRFGIEETQIVSDGRDTYASDDLFFSHLRSVRLEDLRSDGRFGVFCTLV